MLHQSAGGWMVPGCWSSSTVRKTTQEETNLTLQNAVVEDKSTFPTCRGIWLEKVFPKENQARLLPEGTEK